MFKFQSYRINHFYTNAQLRIGKDCKKLNFVWQMRLKVQSSRVLTETVLEVTNAIGNIFGLGRNKLAMFLSDVKITCVADTFFKK